MRILMISSTFPYPPSRGGTEIRTFNLLKHLHTNHEVTVVTQRHDEVSDEDIAALRQYTVQLLIFDLPQSPYLRGVLSPLGKVQRLLTAVASSTPPNVLHRYSPAIQHWIDTHISQGAFDVVTCEHSVNAVYIRPVFRQRVRTILNAHSSVYNWTLNHLHANASDNPVRDRLYLSTIKQYEKRYAQQFSQVIVTTADDQTALLKLCPDLPNTIIPNGVDLELFPYRSSDPGGYELVFVGAMDSSHNIDAARFFVTAVMPLLRQRYPQITLSLVGARPTPAVQALAKHPGVTVTGAVPSIVEYLHRAVVSVVPLRAGFGIKNKTLEAMAAGVPVVGSDRGLEGLSVDQDDEPLRALRANQPEEYVTAIGHLLDNPDLRTRLSKNGRSLVEETYTWQQAGRAYEQALLGDN